MHLQQLLNHFFQPQQVDELIVGSGREEVELGGGGFGRRDLQEGFLQLLTQGQLGRGLPARWGLCDGVGIDRGALQVGWRGLGTKGRPRLAFDGQMDFIHPKGVTAAHIKQKKTIQLSG